MNFHFEKAVQILLRTYPFLLLRLAVYGVVFLASVLWWVSIFLLFLNWPFGGLQWIVWPIGGVLYAVLAKLLRNYVLYLVKAAHIAVITQLVLNDEIPKDSSQIVFGKDRVLQQFLQVSIFFAIDRLVSRVLRAFNRSIFTLLSFLPGRGFLRGFTQKVLDYSVGYVDEAVLSYTMVNPQRNPWNAASDGLVLYVQNWKTILGSGVILALISYTLVVVVAVPGFLFSMGMAEPAKQIVWAVSVAIGLLVKFAVMDPFALTSVIVNFHTSIEQQSPQSEWEQKLASVSRHFKEFKDRASNWSGHENPPAVPPPPPASGPVQIT